jgi:sodium-coupled monocarboxylate transporter 8/12
MALGLISVLAKGLYDIGGLENMWKINSNGGRLNFFDFNPNPFTRQNFWSLIIGMFMYFLGSYGIDQSVVQRFMAAKNLKTAKQAFLFNIPGVFLYITLCSFTGLVLYANYSQCDPLSAPHITNVKNPNQLVIFFVTDKMGSLRGFTGLFVASILSGSLSSVSSILNSMSAIIWADFLSQIKYFKRFDDRKSTMVLKAIVILGGLISTSLAILVSNLKGI